MEVDDNYFRSGLIMDITVFKDQAKNVYKLLILLNIIQQQINAY